jgi:hypothetical protein
LFTNTTKEIAEYVATHYDDAADFRSGLPRLVIPGIVAPARPQPDQNGAYDPIELEDYKQDRAEYKKKLEKRRHVMGKVFALIQGQCSPPLWNMVKSDSNFEAINNQTDVIELLKLIRRCMYQKNTRVSNVLFLSQSLRDFMNFRQPEGMGTHASFQNPESVRSSGAGGSGIGHGVEPCARVSDQGPYIALRESQRESERGISSHAIYALCRPQAV